MRVRRLGVLLCAAVLSMGTVSLVSAQEPVCNPENQVQGQCPDESWEPSSEPTDRESAEPTDKESAEPTDEESDEPSTEPSDEESDEPSTEPTDEESDEPSGTVAGLTSDPTLPPTDGLGASTSRGPDATLPLVLLILGSVGLASVALVPKRSRR